MAVKLLLLKSGETLIADAKELVSEDTETAETSVYAYLFTNPHTVTASPKVFYTKEEREELGNQLEIDVSLSPWILLSKEKEVVVPTNWVVTIVEPLDSVTKMYMEKIKSNNDYKLEELSDEAEGMTND